MKAYLLVTLQLVKHIEHLQKQHSLKNLCMLSLKNLILLLRMYQIQVEIAGVEFEKVSLKDTLAEIKKKSKLRRYKENFRKKPNNYQRLEIHFKSPKELILGDVSKAVTIKSKLRDICNIFVLYHA